MESLLGRRELASVRALGCFARRLERSRQLQELLEALALPPLRRESRLLLPVSPSAQLLRPLQAARRLRAPASRTESVRPARACGPASR